MSALKTDIQQKFSIIFSWISSHCSWKSPVKDLFCYRRLIFAHGHGWEYMLKATRQTLRRWPWPRISTKCHIMLVTTGEKQQIYSIRLHILPFFAGGPPILCQNFNWVTIQSAFEFIFPIGVNDLSTFLAKMVFELDI